MGENQNQRSFRLALLFCVTASIVPVFAQSVLTVPFTVDVGVPMVKVMIDGKGPYTFIFDTGEEHLASLSPKLATELHLTQASMGSTTDPTNGRKIDGPMFRVASLQVGDFKTGNLEVFGIDVGFDGVIGLPLFQNYLCEIQPADRQILLRPGGLNDRNGTDIFEYSVPAGIPDMQMTVAGKPARVHLDSGNPGTISIPQKLTLGLEWATKPIEVGKASTPANTFTLYRGRLRKALALGRYSFPDPLVMVTDTDSDHVNFGFGFFREFQSIMFDQKNQRIRFQRQSPVIRFPEDRD